MGRKRIIIITIIILIIIGVISFIYISKTNSMSFRNVEIYQKSTEMDSDYKKIKITDEQKKLLINYLKKEEFKEIKEEIKCPDIMPLYRYIISFDNYQISFDDNGCYIFMRDFKENNEIIIELTKELKNYVKEIAK